jgi:PAS domain S-box-containing protein
MSTEPQLSILVVDDEATNRQLLSWLFRDAGYLVRESSNAQEALALARSDSPPDLIVLDVNLPDLSGFEVCQQLKSEAGTQTISVIHLSAVHVDSDARAQGLDQGADAYLVKPVDPGELLATVRAILRIRTAEEAARQAANEWRATFDALSDSVCVIDSAGIITRCNRAMTELLECDYQTLIGQSLVVVVKQGLCTNECDSLNWLLTPETRQRQAEELALGKRIFRIVVEPMTGGGAVVIFQDITHHRELEEQVRKGQRLEAIGQLAAGVAHEFNNLLATIVGNLSMLSGALSDPMDQSALATAERSAWRAAELTRQLQGFSRQALLWLRPLQASQLLQQALEEIRPELPTAVTVQTQLEPLAPTVQADPELLRQVFRQLCRHAAGTMQNGGTLSVSVGVCEFDPEQTIEKPDCRPGRFVRISIGDTGPGIAPELVERVFEPFFSQDYQPGGLGLAMVYGIVKQHLGWIECHSEVGKGTRFDLYLPAMLDIVASSRPIAATVVPRPGPRKILLADDNEILLTLATRFLRQDGYEVFAARDSLHALELFQREQGRIDLAILDHVMPDGNGYETLQQMRQLTPKLRALIATDSGELVSSEFEDVQGIIQKPYRERELLHAVHHALSLSTTDNSLAKRN